MEWKYCLGTCLSRSWKRRVCQICMLHRSAGICVCLSIYAYMLICKGYVAIQHLWTTEQCFTGSQPTAETGLLGVRVWHTNIETWQSASYLAPARSMPKTNQAPWLILLCDVAGRKVLDLCSVGISWDVLHPYFPRGCLWTGSPWLDPDARLCQPVAGNRFS